METGQYWSRLQGFFDLSIADRRKVIAALPLAIGECDFSSLDNGLSIDDADCMSENVIGTFGLPLSVACNFVVDKESVLVPMVTEEPSIVAACSKMAKLVGKNGGFSTHIDSALVKGQIQIFRLPDMDRARAQFLAHKDALMALANELCPSMKDRGGGVVDIGMRILPSKKIGPMLVIEPMVNVVDAMGANAVNTLLEKLAVALEEIFDGTMGVKILSNLCDQRLAKARCQIDIDDLAFGQSFEHGLMLAQKMVAAHALAEADVYRACTHNKGILNGMDAVAIATGNDFRAIEAGAHAYAAAQGVYGPLTSITINEAQQKLEAELLMPLAVGVVGGISDMHAGVLFAHKLLGSHAASGKRLSSVMVSVGLSQCLAALLALCKDGIQNGHMKLHSKKRARVRFVQPITSNESC